MPKTNNQETSQNQNPALDQKLNVIPAAIPDQNSNVINTTPTQSPNSFFYYLSKHIVFGSVLILLTGLVIGFLAFEAIAPEDSRISKQLGFTATSSSTSSVSNTSQNNTNSSSSSISSSSNISSSSSSSSLASSSTSSSVSSSLPISVTPISNPKIYTNQYFPNFKLVYPEDWKFETKTKTATIQGLLNRTIFLSKNDIILEINLFPKIPPQCGGGGSTVTNTETFNSGVKKLFYRIYTDSSSNVLSKDLYISYGDILGCIAGQIETNIDTKFSSNYKTEFNNYNKDDSKVIYLYNIQLNRPLYSTDPLVNEIDQIISQSSFN